MTVLNSRCLLKAERDNFRYNFYQGCVKVKYYCKYYLSGCGISLDFGMTEGTKMFHISQVESYFLDQSICEINTQEFSAQLGIEQ